MLTLYRESNKRPATRSRRPFPFGLALVALLGIVACAPAHVPDIDGARRTVTRAIRELRPHAPKEARYLERLLADAEVATAGELSAPPWRRTPGRGEAAWLRAVIAAREAMTAQRAATAVERRSYLELLARVTPTIARARDEISETGMGRREGAAMERASVSFDTAARLASAGDYRRAADKLRQTESDAAVIHQAWLSLHARFSDPLLRREWNALAQAVIRESRDRAESAVVVDKLRRRLILYYRGLRVATFVADLGANGLRRKEYAGDRATPEGLYHVIKLKEGRATNYYKALLLDYPNEHDRQRFEARKRRGLIPRRAGIGGMIEVHGEGGEGDDWTDGCVALTNKDMDVLFARVRPGTPVAIVGTYRG